MEEKFMRHIRKNEKGCWIWIGASPMYPKYKNMSAHRFAWISTHCKIPDGNILRHKCFNPRCVNLEHLEVTTREANLRHIKHNPDYQGKPISGVDPKKFITTNVFREMLRENGIHRSAFWVRMLIASKKIKSYKFYVSRVIPIEAAVKFISKACRIGRG